MAAPELSVADRSRLPKLNSALSPLRDFRDSTGRREATGRMRRFQLMQDDPHPPAGLLPSAGLRAALPEITLGEPNDHCEALRVVGR